MGLPWAGKLLSFVSAFRSNDPDSFISSFAPGYTIPKGWKVLVWLRAFHMDPENHVEPKEFNPERWENQRAKAEAFIPFGEGGRSCPGNELAKLDIYVFLHRFLLNYEFERCNPECPVEYFPAPKPKDNFLAKIKRVA